ncbi:MAG: ParB/RepB/Spo0J family partition protein [Planctomycetes bacterium]|nr:ParB/RepB/Spo0J family partition protein [Planctomycetota bacterium]
MGLSDSGLGRSVSDVLAKTMRRGEPSKGYLEVDIGLITAPKANPRQQFDQGALDELAASLRQHGMLQPIVVMKRDVGYEILSGERRFRAAKLAGLAKVPVVVREEENPQHVAELRLIENIQRENLNPIELANAYRLLLEQHGLTHDDLAGRVNKDRSSVTNILRLLTLDEFLQKSLSQGLLTLGHAKALLSCADPAWQRTLADRIVAEGLSVRDTERLAKAGPPKAGAGGRTEKPSHVRELETNLFQLLGTRVRVKEKGGKGNLTLYFDSNDQFQRVVAIMTRFVKQASIEDRKG